MEVIVLTAFDGTDAAGQTLRNYNAKHSVSDIRFYIDAILLHSIYNNPLSYVWITEWSVDSDVSTCYCKFFTKFRKIVLVILFNGLADPRKQVSELVAHYFNQVLWQDNGRNKPCLAVVDRSKLHKTDYVNGHAKKIINAPLCACGCGQNVKWDKWKCEWNKFISGHLIRDEKMRQKMSESAKKRPPESFYQFNRPLDEEIKNKISKTLKGRFVENQVLTMEESIPKKLKQFS
jgi:hypothetical protein